jgi:hypothetical protein
MLPRSSVRLAMVPSFRFRGPSILPFRVSPFKFGSWARVGYIVWLLSSVLPTHICVVRIRARVAIFQPAQSLIQRASMSQSALVTNSMAWKLTSAEVEREIRFSAHNLTPRQKFVGAKVVRFYPEPGKFRSDLSSDLKCRTSKSQPPMLLEILARNIP